MRLPQGWLRVLPHESNEFYVRREWIANGRTVRVRRVISKRPRQGSYQGYWWCISHTQRVAIGVGKSLRVAISDYVTNTLE